MKFLATLLTLSLVSATACAETPADLARLRSVLDRLNVDTAPQDLAPAPVADFLEVVRGMQVLYVSRDGSLLINGEILSLATETNLTEQRRAAIRKRLLSNVPLDQRIVIPASGAARATITIFTDIRCPYCLQLHSHRAELARWGIEIHYLFYPRSGPSSESYSQAVAIWCSADRVMALEAVYNGATLPVTECSNPIMKHYELARELELKGTPAIVTSNGNVRYGALTVRDIVDAVEQSRQD